MIIVGFHCRETSRKFGELFDALDVWHKSVKLSKNLPKYVIIFFYCCWVFFIWVETAMTVIM